MKVVIKLVDWADLDELISIIETIKAFQLANPTIDVEVIF